MLTFYTLMFVIAFFAVAIPLGKRIYPNGSGDDAAPWVYRLPNVILALTGSILLAVGLAALWMSGQVLFGAHALSIESYPSICGLLAGILICLYGVRLYGVILLKNKTQ